MFPGLYGRASQPPPSAAEIKSDLSVSTARNAAATIRELEDRLDRLLLANIAMWSLVREKTGLTEEDLLERVRQIDLSDGQEDGKLRTQVVRCAKCDRVMARRHRTCLYCGADKLDPTAFDAAL